MDRRFGIGAPFGQPQLVEIVECHRGRLTAQQVELLHFVDAFADSVPDTFMGP